MDILKATADRFGGIVIDADAVDATDAEFAVRLAHSVETWQREGFKVVWIELPIEKAALIPPTAQAGFSFHHSREMHLTLTKRLEPDAFIPPYATHYIGAGGVVLNDERELLVVSERYRRDHSRPYWKLPGGALMPGEHLVDGVVREVFEETGIRAQFDTLVCFRHWHGYRYGKSDIYFICRLSPLSSEITKDDHEIDDCCWMPVDDYLGSEYVGDFNKRIVRSALDSHGIPRSWVDGYSDPDSYEFFIPA